MSLKVEFGFTRDSSGNVIFNDITSYVRRVSSTRGKDPQQDTYNAGQLSISLNNQLRTFDPTYASGPFAGEIVPSGSVRVSYDVSALLGSYPIFTGFITDWNFTYDQGGVSIAELVATDAFGTLNNQTLIDYTPVTELSSVRVNTILSRPEVGGPTIYPGSLREISEGLETVGNYAVSEGQNVLAYLQEIEKAEGGRLFISKSGVVTFRSARDIAFPVPWTFTRVNLSTNPKTEVNTTDFSNTAYIGGSPTTMTRVSGGFVGDWALGAENAIIESATFATTVGAVYTVSCWVKINTAGATGTILLMDNPVPITINNTTWTRVAHTFTATATTSRFRVSPGDTDTALNEQILYSGFLYEQAALVDNYFDGDFINAYNTSDPDQPDYQPWRNYQFPVTSWQGTPENSRSTVVVDVTPPITNTAFNENPLDGIPFSSILVEYGSEYLYNQIEASTKSVSAVPQLAESSVSQELYGIRGYKADNLLNSTDAGALKIAKALLTNYFEPDYRPESLVLNLKKFIDDDNTLSIIFNLELDDKISIGFTPNGIGDASFNRGILTGIAHTITQDSHEVELRLKQLKPSFVLDSVDFGVLDRSRLGI